MLEYLGPILLAVLFEEGGVEGDAAGYLGFCGRAMLVADLRKEALLVLHLSKFGGVSWERKFGE